MNVKIWNEESDRLGLKTPVLKLAWFGNDRIELQVVDYAGNYVASLIRFADGKLVRCIQAREALENNGYDTSFGQWNERGQIVDRDNVEEDRAILIEALEKMEAMPDYNGMMKAKKIAANALERVNHGDVE